MVPLRAISGRGCGEPVAARSRHQFDLGGQDTANADARRQSQWATAFAQRLRMGRRQDDGRPPTDWNLYCHFQQIAVGLLDQLSWP